MQNWELLSAYLDGETTPEERTSIESWLANDREAQAWLLQAQVNRAKLRQSTIRQLSKCDIWSSLEEQLPAPLSTLACETNSGVSFSSFRLPEAAPQTGRRAFHRQTRKRNTWVLAASFFGLIGLSAFALFASLPQPSPSLARLTQTANSKANTNDPSSGATVASGITTPNDKKTKEIPAAPAIHLASEDKEQLPAPRVFEGKSAEADLLAMPLQAEDLLELAPLGKLSHVLPFVDIGRDYPVTKVEESFKNQPHLRVDIFAHDLTQAQDSIQKFLQAKQLKAVGEWPKNARKDRPCFFYTESLGVEWTTELIAQLAKEERQRREKSKPDNLERVVLLQASVVDWDRLAKWTGIPAATWKPGKIKATPTSPPMLEAETAKRLANTGVKPITPGAKLYLIAPLPEGGKFIGPNKDAQSYLQARPAAEAKNLPLLLVLHPL